MLIDKYKDKKVLILIESPLQLLCAYEAIEYFNVDFDLYIRLSNHEADNLQILNTVDALNIKKVKYLYLSTNYGFGAKLGMLKQLIFFKFKKYDYYILGNYLSGFVKQFVKRVSKNRTILLDDGVATFQIQRELQKEFLPLTLFTIFDLEKFDTQEIYINKFTRLKHLYKTTTNAYDIFIGGKLVDLDILTLDSYIGTIKVAYESSTANKFVYFPHRRTSQEVLDAIVSLGDIEIVYPDTTIEYYLLKEGVKPNNIYSILSSALFSLSILFEDANVVAYKPTFLKNDREDNIEKLYEIIKNMSNKIKLVNLSESK